MGKICRLSIKDNSIEQQQIDKALSGYIVEDKIDENHIIIRNDKDFSIWAVIDSDENIIIPYQRGMISRFNASCYLRIEDSFYRKVGVYTFDGKEILPKKFEKIDYHTNCFIAQQPNPDYSNNKDNVYGLFDLEGRILIPVSNYKISYVGRGVFKIIKNNYSNRYNSDSSKDTDRFSLFFSENKKRVYIPGEKIEFIEDSSILISPRELEEHEYYSQGYMLLSLEGETLSPKDTYEISEFNEKGLAYITVKSKFPGIWQHKGLINKKGVLSVTNKEKIIPMPKGFDWVTDYKNEIADFYIKDRSGHINLKGEKAVKINIDNNERIILLPQKYEFAIDSNTKYVQVIKNCLMGIIDDQCNEIIPPIYNYIDVIFDETKKIIRFVCFLKNKSQLIKENYKELYEGLADIYDESGYKINDDPFESPRYIGNGLFKVKSEPGQFKRIKPNLERDYDIVDWQILDRNGKIINNDKFSSISTFFRHIEYDDGTETVDEYDQYAIFTLADTWGAIDENGNIVLSGVEHPILSKDVSTFLIKDNIQPELYKISEISVPFNHNYSYIKYVGYGLFLVKSLIKINDEEVEGSTYVDFFNRPLTPMSGGVSEIKNNVFISYVDGNGKYLQGIFDIHGNVIIPYCNYDFKLFDNFIFAKTKEYKPIVYSYSGEIIFPLDMFQNGDQFEDFLDYFIKVKRYYSDYEDLYNIKGKLLYEGSSNSYTKYESIIPGILKIQKIIWDDRYYFLGDYNGNIKSKSYEKIDIFNNGLCRVSETKHVGYSDYDGRKLYKTLYGVINILGEEITPILYETLQIFENENIIKTCKGNLTYEGRFIAFYENESGVHNLILEKKYDYCLTFENGYAIVFKEEQCGIINEEGTEIFPIKCAKIERITKNIVKFKINQLWGLFDINRGIIIPNKYSSIREFENGYAIVSYRPMDNVRYYGIVSFEKEILEPIYSNLIRYNERIVAYSTGIAGKWIIFNLENKTTIPLNSSIKILGNLSEGLIRFNKNGTAQRNKYGTCIKAGKWGFMNIEGNVIIEAEFDVARDFCHNLAPVKRNGKWGFINLEGTQIVPYEYDDISKNDFGYLAIKLIEDDKHWFKFNDKGSIIEQGIEETEIEDDYNSGWDNSPSIYDNPYYNDNLDMDQQSIDFWNSL